MLPQKLKYLFISFVVSLVALQGFDMIQVARADTVADMELGLSMLINTARTDPLGTAASLGLDPQQVLEDLPELEEILTQGLPPFENNALLHEAAFNHTQDMLTQNYFSKISPDGRSPCDRIAETGYDSNITGETPGILAFYNFIGSETAVNILFKNMFLDELNPERTEPRNILNPEIQDMGIGIGTGVMDLGAGRYNVYLTTCDFAASGASILEMELLGLTNQARENPLEVAASLGMDPDQLLEELPSLERILTYGLPPLSFNPALFHAARLHARDMLTHQYFSEISLDGRTLDDRLVQQGFFPLFSGELLGSFQSPTTLSPVDRARMIFASKFKAELNPERTEPLKILNPDFTQAGAGFFDMVSNIDEKDVQAYSLLVCDVGTSEAAEPPSLFLMVYNDVNENRLFDPGEGIPKMPVSIQTGDQVFDFMTDSAGMLNIALETGEYWLILNLGEKVITQGVSMGGENLFMGVRADGN